MSEHDGALVARRWRYIARMQELEPETMNVELSKRRTMGSGSATVTTCPKCRWDSAG